jgi:hypothetical protein
MGFPNWIRFQFPHPFPHNFIAANKRQSTAMQKVAKIRGFNER